MATAALSVVEAAKRAAAFRAVDAFVRDGTVVGVGSGSTVVYAAERLGQRVRSEGLKITCIPTSFQAEEVRLAAADRVVAGIAASCCRGCSRGGGSRSSGSCGGAARGGDALGCVSLAVRVRVCVCVLSVPRHSFVRRKV